LLDRYDGDHEAALTAYHSGPTNFDKKGKKAENMGTEGKAYAAKVMKWYKEGIPADKNWELPEIKKQGQ
jgi:soluble lytic murein transglycosylase-like protein